ncbi:MAG TPA: sugar-binding protein [Anaerolineales bacterium]|nr:sugar-binding protein [Anaerolineales bacterium]
MFAKRVVYLAFFFIFTISLAACNFPGSAGQPTISPNLIYTAAAQTLAAQQTAAAQGTPVILPSPTGEVGPAPTNTALPPTNTPLPTNTTIPSATSTSVPPSPTFTSTAIARVSSEASSLSKPPTIDGTWDEWTTTQYPIKTVVFGSSNWSGSSDLQASYRVGWDSQFLYLAVKVFDDVYVQNATGANLYKGDSIEVLLSTSPNADSSSLGLTAADYQIGISPGRLGIGQSMEAYLWYPQAKAGSLNNVAMGAVPMTDGYRIEFAIPWSVFGISPVKGQVFGFAASVSDNDSKTQDVQQTVISSAPHRVLTDPTSWGLLTLK